MGGESRVGSGEAPRRLAHRTKLRVPIGRVARMLSGMGPMGWGADGGVGNNTAAEGHDIDVSRCNELGARMSTAKEDVTDAGAKLSRSELRVLTVMTLLALLVGFAVVSDIMTTNELSRARVVIAYVLVMVTCLAAFVAGSDHEDRMVGEDEIWGFVVGSLIVWAAAGAYYLRIEWIQWSFLLLLVFLSLLYLQDDRDPNTSVASNLLYMGWVLLAPIATAGSGRYLGYLDHVLDYGSMHVLLDLRYATTAIVFLVVLADAIRHATKGGKPLVPRLRLMDIGLIEDARGSLVLTVLQPIALVLHVLVRGLEAVLDVSWRLLATTGVYVGRVAVAAADTLLDIVTRKRLWRHITSVGAIFAASVALVWIAPIVAQEAIAYLRSGLPSRGILIVTGLSHVLRLGAFLLSSLLAAAVVVNVAADFHPANLGRAAQFGSVVMVAMTLAALPLYVLAADGRVQMAGFHMMGPFSLVMAALFLVVFIWRSLLWARDAMARRGGM